MESNEEERQPKRQKRDAPGICSAEYRAKTFPEDFYHENGQLFCRHCVIVVDHVRLDSVKQHLKAKKHR